MDSVNKESPRPAAEEHEPELQSLDSDNDSTSVDKLAGDFARVENLEAPESSDDGAEGEGDDDNESLEISSEFEETIQEIGDEHLFNGGKDPELSLLSNALRTACRAGCMHSRRGCIIPSAAANSRP